MGSITKLQRLRRANLARLRRERGANRVAELTEIPPAMLYQMALGRGTSARNISDDTARRIERACQLPEGWLDRDHDRPHHSDNWPFSIPKGRFDALTPEQRNAVDHVVTSVIEAQELLAKGRAAEKQPRAG